MDIISILIWFQTVWLPEVIAEFFFLLIFCCWKPWFWKISRRQKRKKNCQACKAPTKHASEIIVCFSHLLHIYLLILLTNVKCIGKQCGPRSDCSNRSSLIWIHTVCQSCFQNISVDAKRTTFVVIGGIWRFTGKVSIKGKKRDFVPSTSLGSDLYRSLVWVITVTKWNGRIPFSSWHCWSHAIQPGTSMFNPFLHEYSY